MRESDNLAATNLLDERRKLRDRLRWAGDPDLVKVVVNGTYWLADKNLTDKEHKLAMACAESFFGRQLEANTEALKQLGITIEEDAE